MSDEKKKPSFIKKILGLVFTICITAVVTAIVNYHLAPVFIETSIEVSADECCETVNDTEIYSLFRTFNDPEISVFLDNNNSGHIRIEEIYVRTNIFTELNVDDIILRTDIGGSGDVEEPIYLISKVSARNNGVYKCDFNYELGNYSSGEYIEIAPNSSDKLFINLEPVFSGKYDIQVEIKYTYNGKSRTIATEPCTFIYMNYPIIDNFTEGE